MRIDLTRKAITAVIAVLAPIAIGYGITSGMAVGSVDGDSGSERSEQQHVSDGWTVDRIQDPGEPPVVVVTDPDGNVVEPGQYQNLPPNIGDAVVRYSADDYEPPDPFGSDGPYGPNGAWELRDAELPCYNQAFFGPDLIDVTTGPWGDFGGATGLDGEWVQEPVYFDADENAPGWEVLGPHVKNGTAAELDGAQLLAPCG